MTLICNLGPDLESFVVQSDISRHENTLPVLHQQGFLPECFLFPYFIVSFGR